MILTVLQEGNPRLREKSVDVVTFASELSELAHNMLQTMLLGKGIGLAAPQVGVLQRLIVVDIQPPTHREPRPYILCNPVITKMRHRMLSREGCLSVDRSKWGIPIQRSKLIDVDYQDLNGEPQGMRARGLLACVIQHEIDHLDGILITDYKT